MPETATQTPTGFDGLGLHHALRLGVDAAGFKEPRTIQQDTIPAALSGRDVLGLAQTGTGKTAAFALPLMQRVLTARGGRPDPRALVLAPTRELATQIAEEMRMLGRFSGLQVVTVFGGAPMGRQIAALRKRPQIVVGCPGRLLDLVGQRHLRLCAVETLVLDEADQMFDMGFLPDIRRILGELPPRRQNLLFSATMPGEIRRLADELLHDPHVVELADRAPVATVDHALYPVNEERKRDLLTRMLGDRACTSAIVFTRTKHRARRLAEQLERAGHRAVGLQGNMTQGQRDRAMRGFREGRYDVLVATDVAARGIDVAEVSHVINYDVPMTPEAYTHRIGRTGRGEASGIACTFVTRGDRAWVRATEQMIGSEIPRRHVDGFDARGEDGPRRSQPGGRSRPHGSGGGPKGRGPQRGRRSGPTGGGKPGGGKPGGGKRPGRAQRRQSA